MAGGSAPGSRANSPQFKREINANSSIGLVRLFLLFIKKNTNLF
jgi:hypothetical protein